MDKKSQMFHIPVLSQPGAISRQNVGVAHPNRKMHRAKGRPEVLMRLHPDTRQLEQVYLGFPHDGVAYPMSTVELVNLRDKLEQVLRAIRARGQANTFFDSEATMKDMLPAAERVVMSIPR